MYNVLKKVCPLPLHAALLYAAKILIGSAIIAIAAQISVPFYPVPMTLHPESVILISLFCRPTTAIGITTAYGAEALMGLPVLQGGSGGIATVLGTTGGYILGFILMSALISNISARTTMVWKRSLGCILGSASMYICGVSWLSHYVGVESALKFGLYPFLPKAALSMVFVTLVMQIVKNFQHKWVRHDGR